MSGTLFVCAGQASATTIDLAPPSGTFGPSYSQDGYTFTSSPGDSAAFLNWAVLGLPLFNASNSNGDLVVDYSDSTVIITNNESQPFSFSSIGLASGTNTKAGGTVNFTFLHADGTIDTSTVTLTSGLLGLQTFDFNESDLTSVSFVNGPFFLEQFDNVVVSTSAVPETPTWAMMILGFCGLGFMTSRRKNKIALGVA
jgi:hypothetical protein